MNLLFTHKSPTPEPDDEPIPDHEPEPDEDPVPHPDPVAVPSLRTEKNAAKSTPTHPKATSTQPTVDTAVDA